MSIQYHVLYSVGSTASVCFGLHKSIYMYVVAYIGWVVLGSINAKVCPLWNYV